MYDVIVIGGGPGGYAAAIRASQLGGKVALVECGQMGGTCVNTGCIPSKTWLRAAALLALIREGHEFGIQAAIEQVNLQAIVDRKNGVATDIRMGMEALLQNNGVSVLRGRAVIKGPREIAVEDTVYEAKTIIVATGSSLAFPPIPGLKEAAFTTDQLFEMTDVPSSILVCDSGYIEVEMAFLLNSFGCKVVLATESSRVLAREDHDTSQRITQSLREKGVEVLTRHTLKSITKAESGAGWSCVLSAAADRSVEVQKVLVAWRKPATVNMGLEQVGVKLNEDGGILVDNRLETSVKGIYAIGDVIGGWMFSHAASSMAIVAGENCMERGSTYPFHLIPRGLWTSPEVGAVGLSEEEAEKRGLEIEVGTLPYAINGLAMSRGEVEGSVKVVSDSRYGEILGVHIVGAGATDLVGEAILAMQLEATVNELARSIRVHPTYSETVADAAKDTAGWALYLPKR
ncbi:dihydrolipoyl dehydrogenase [Desulfomonile tiedjei]|uniref:Dihydrolipoyl dehydrogenase n=1 Tax=Desulfomonile tiedjei (strain ATCC 49306 / DSM 6799 / DCB-1) TaxID=706587 RepID=I4C1N9_DESTA|nr:dihydrolipoyl dehydrogenase [Desulfomonile tiedjei]AFM23480.1 dihydrolipoamide dehydrogenase [Desulfomonile tiedjei DSM 6799]